MPISIPIVDGIFKVIDKIIPDRQAAAQAQMEILRMNQAGEFKQIETDLQLALGQLEVNKIEAAAPDLFRGGWRPLCGYVCVGGLAYQFMLQPLLGWASGIWEIPAPPAIDMGDLLVLLGGMLGLGGFRTAEKFRGVAK